MVDKSLRRKIEALKRQKIVQEKVVDLSNFRSLKERVSPTILVVDDDETVRYALKRMLETEGYKIILAQDGLELSKTLESTRLDMILLDINLPWVDGWELCELIKSHVHFKKVPLVIISARREKEDVDRAMAAGADDYITKPFEMNQMLSVVQNFLMGALA